MIEQVQDGVADHALGGLDPAEHQHRRIRHDLAVGQPARPGDRREQRVPVHPAAIAACRLAASSAKAAEPCRSPRSARWPSPDCPARADTAATISSYQDRITLGSVSARGRARRRRPRPPAARPGCAAARPGPPPRTRPPAGGLGLGELFQPGRRRRPAGTPRRTGPVPLVLRAVQRQHARPDHPGGREPGVVHGERRGCRAAPAGPGPGGSPASRRGPAATTPARARAAAAAPGAGSPSRSRMVTAAPSGNGRADRASSRRHLTPAHPGPARILCTVTPSELAEQPAGAGHRRPGRHAPVAQLPVGGHHQAAPGRPGASSAIGSSPEPGRPPPGPGRPAGRGCACRASPAACAAATDRAAPSTTSTISGKPPLQRRAPASLRAARARRRRPARPADRAAGRRPRPGPATSRPAASP